MIDLLTEAYPRHYKSTKQIEPAQIHHSTTNIERFELNDNVSIGICPNGEGVAIFSNLINRNIELINFENYINLFGSGVNAGKGRKCDFLVYDAPDTPRFFICAELTKSKEKYIEPYTANSKPKSGKRAMAVAQLSESINKLMAVDEINERISLYQNKIGLFAYRLTDESEADSPVSQMNKAFNRFSEEIPALQTTKLLPNDFVFSQRMYPASFDV